MNRKINWESIIKWYIGVFLIVVMYILMPIGKQGYFGEQDDYTMPVVSFFNDGNFVISEDDWEYADKLFPSWSSLYQNSRINNGLLLDDSGEPVRDSNNEQLTWYFPIYSAYLVPFVWLMKVLKVSCEYAIRVANIFSLVCLLLVCLKNKRLSGINKLFTVIALSLNPVLLIMLWGTSETFLFSLLAMSILFWIDNKKHRAAFLCSIAGMINTTVLFWGIIMIAEYLYRLYKGGNQKNVIMVWCNKWKSVVLYGICYIPALIPMIYFYAYTGHISPQAGSCDINASRYLGRFLSYLFDLNLGIFPYYLVFGIAFFLFAIVCLIKRKNIEYLCLVISFLGILAIYSTHGHINCGMEGIARYSVWNSTFICIGVPFFLQSVTTFNEKKSVSITRNAVISIGLLLTFLVTISARTYNCQEMLPIAKLVLDKCPQLYNPLHSTFNSRVSHIDGGYEIVTPVVYIADDGYVRKILASSNDRDQLIEEYTSCIGNDEWFIDAVNSLKNDATYISVPKKLKLARTKQYVLRNPIVFTRDGYNADGFVNTGINLPEDWGSWTEGNELVMRLKIDSNCELYNVNIACSIYGKMQEVTIYANDKKVYSNTNYVGEGINFEFENPGINQPIELRIEMPNAVDLSKYGDNRVVALGLQQLVIDEKNTP